MRLGSRGYDLMNPDEAMASVSPPDHFHSKIFEDARYFHVTEKCFPEATEADLSVSEIYSHAILPQISQGPCVPSNS